MAVLFTTLIPNALARTPRKFDEFGRLACSDELARLDNYAEALRPLPDALAVVVIYGGRSDTRRGEVIAHLFGIRDYLVNHHSFDATRVVLKDGGFLEHLRIDLWITPSNVRDSIKYLIDDSIALDMVHLNGSPIRKWKYRCASR